MTHMVKVGVVLGLAAVGGLSLWGEDFVVGTGETLDLSELARDDAKNMYDNEVRVMVGATITCSEPFTQAEGQPGFTVLGDGRQFRTAADWPQVGDREEDVLRKVLFDTELPISQGTYAEERSTPTSDMFRVYSAYWTIPEDGIYSLWEHFASSVAVILDGKVVLSDTVWNKEHCVRDIALTAGRHTLTIIEATPAGQPYGHANAQLVPGLAFSPNNDEMTFTNYKTINSGADPYPAARHFANVEGENPIFTTRPLTGITRGPRVRARVMLDGGTIDLACPNGVIPWFYGGLFATNGASLHVTEGNLIDVGYLSWKNGIHFAFLSAPVTFDAEGGHVRLVKRVTLTEAPENLEIPSGTVVALMTPDLLGGADEVALRDYDVYLLSEDAVKSNATVTVGSGRTLFIKPCKISSTEYWGWAGYEATNYLNVTLDGGTLTIQTTPNYHLDGNITGTGNVMLNYGETSSMPACTTELRGNVDLNGTLTVKTPDLILTTAQTVGANAKVTLSRQMSYANQTPVRYRYGTLRFVPSGTVSVAHVEGAYEENVLYVGAEQTMALGKASGTFTVQGDDAATSQVTLADAASAGSVVFKNLARVTVVGTGGSISVAGAGTEIVASSLGTLTLVDNAQVVLASGTQVTAIEGAGTVTFAGNQTVEKVGDGVYVRTADSFTVSGTTPVRLADGAAALTVAGSATAAGVFAGTATVAAGGTLVVPAARLPLTEAEIPRENQMGWYDPDDDTRYVKRTITDDTRPLAVDALFSKESGTTLATYQNTTPFLSGYLGQEDYQTADANNAADRRPWKAEGARGVGPRRTWLDFTVYPEYDGSGNVLRFKNVYSQSTSFGNATRIEKKWKTAFVVTDTSKGGGNPLPDGKGGNTMCPKYPRKGSDYTAPIWAKGTLEAITNGETRLDGVTVNGCEQGFSGRPELLTVQTDGTDSSLWAVGYYNDASDTKKNETSYEILGEMLFYTTVLDATTRADIEAYLMKKWLGKLPEGYVDWRGATVTGAGTVQVAQQKLLPSVAPGFTGTLDLADTALTFGVDAAGAVTNALLQAAEATLRLPEAGTVTVAFAGRPKDCVLAAAGTIAGLDPARWTVTLEPAVPGAEYTLVVRDGQLRLRNKNAGTWVLIR